MKVLVGLGNPGLKYQFTRHNFGFMLIDHLAKTDSISKKLAFQKKHSSLILKTRDYVLVKPQTFMNLSGQALRQVMSFYKVSLEDLIVIHDDKDLPFTSLRFQKNRGHGGHNGIRDTHQALGSKDYCRLKMGVEPLEKESQSTADMVLSSFSQAEQKQIPTILDRAKKAIQCWIKEGYEKASNQFN